MDDNARYLYEIRPIKPIIGLIPNKTIMKPHSMQLTKSEVEMCMKCGPVYRKFRGEVPMRVTGENLDKLHSASLTNSTTSNLSDVINTAKDFVHIVKCRFSSFSGLGTFVDDHGKEHDELYEKYKNQIHIINNSPSCCIIDSLKGRRIPVEFMDEKWRNEKPNDKTINGDPDNSEENGDFLGENGEESDALTCNLTDYKEHKESISGTLHENVKSSPNENKNTKYIPNQGPRSNGIMPASKKK